MIEAAATTAPLVEALLSNPPLAIADCAANPCTDGQNCYPSSLGGYGTCRQQQCLPRCIDEKDCRPGDGDGGVVGSCDRSDSSLLGLCQPEASDAR